MIRHSHHCLHHRIHGNTVAVTLVQHVADQWLQGLPLRLARKILRKQGVHAWSLLVPVTGEPWTRLIQLLNPPRWLIDACLFPFFWEANQGLFIKELPKGAHLPEGLVSTKWGLLDSPHLRRMPNRIWAESLLIGQCSSLERLPMLVCRPVDVDVSGCHRLKVIPTRAGPVNLFSLGDCKELRAVPPLPEHGTFWSEVNLNGLPRLRRISQRGSVHGLFVRDCPNLLGLSEFTVDYELVVHRCPALRSLPKFKGRVKGRVTDCPGLGEVDLAGALPEEGSALKVQPLRGACRLPPILPKPTVQSVVMAPLLPSSAFEDGLAWPWPPVPRMVRNAPLDRALIALGLSILEQMYCQVQPGRTLANVVYDRLSNSANPGAALRLVRGLICESLAKGDTSAFEILLCQADIFGIGLLSIWLALSDEQREAMLPLLPSWWRVRLAGTSNLEEISEALDGVPGPLIFAGNAYVGHGLGPTAIQGPVWVGGGAEFNDVSELEGLPDLMVVKGDLVITKCPALRHFPGRLEVGGDLSIDGLPRLERSVCRVAVGGKTAVLNAPALRLVPLGSWEQ